MKGILNIDLNKLKRLYSESIDSYFHLLIRLEGSEMTWGVIYHNQPDKGYEYETEADIVFLDRFLKYEEDASSSLSIGNTLELIGPGTGKVATFKIIENSYSDLKNHIYKKNNDKEETF